MKEIMDCVVVEVTPEKTIVQTRAHSECSSCGACSGGNAIVYDAVNPIHAKVGDEVEIEVEKINILKASFIIFVIPLLTISVAIGLGIGSATLFHLAKGLTILISLVICMGSMFLLLKRFDQGISIHSDIPVITKIL